MNDFLKTTEFNRYSETAQKLVTRFLENLKLEEIGFVVKVRGGVHKVIAIAYDKKPTSNIVTVYILEEHIRVERHDKQAWSLKSKIDVDSYYYTPLIERYYNLNTPKKQQSIYIHKDILDKVELIAKEENKTMNEVIGDCLRERTAGLFLNIRHRIEFIELLKQGDLYRNDIGLMDEELERFIIFAYIVAAYQMEYEEFSGSKIKAIKEDDKLFYEVPNSIEPEVSLNPAYILALAILHREDFISVREFMDEQLSRLTFRAISLLKQGFVINIDLPDIMVKPEKTIVEAPPWTI